MEKLEAKNAKKKKPLKDKPLRGEKLNIAQTRMNIATINNCIDHMKVFVVERDITDAQNLTKKLF